MQNIVPEGVQIIKQDITKPFNTYIEDGEMKFEPNYQREFCYELLDCPEGYYPETDNENAKVMQGPNAIRNGSNDYAIFVKSDIEKQDNCSEYADGTIAIVNLPQEAIISNTVDKDESGITTTYTLENCPENYYPEF